jgi:PAS domain S-box-containing protein
MTIHCEILIMDKPPFKTGKIHSLSNLLILSLIITVVVVSAVSIALIYLNQVEQAKADLQDKADETMAYLVGGLELPIWDINEPTIKVIGQTIFQNEFVIRLEIKDETGQTLFFKEELGHTDTISRTATIYHNNLPIGQVALHLSGEAYNARNQQELLFTVVTISTVLVALIIVTGIFMRTVLKKPFDRLNEIIKAYTAGQYHSDTSIPYREFEPFGQVLAQMGQTITRQLTEVKEAEEKFRRIFENMQEGYILTDLDGVPIMANPSAAQLLRYELEGLLHTSPSSIYDNPADRLRLLGLLKRKGRLSNYEILLRCKDGQTIIADCNIQFVLNQAGDPIAIEGVFRDMTERKRAEEALRQSNHRLAETLVELKQTQEKMMQQERLAAVGQLAAGIAHDFNNILTGILGFTELLQLSPDTPAEMQSSLHQISISSQRAALLVRQLLDFSRKTIRHTQQMDLTDFISEIARFLERTIPENIHISLNLPPGHLLIKADSTQIQQVITNLTVNARDAMPGGGQLTIGLAQIELAGAEKCSGCGQPIIGKYVCLTVADTGSGIPPEVMPHIFEPFYTTKGVGHGTGLGLSQVYGIVEQHNGHLTVASRLNQGTTFAIYLPLSASQTPVAPEKKSAVQLGDGQTILLVEDEKIVLEVTKTMLEKLGYRVIAAANGREAIAAYEQHLAGVDLVLSDMIMPDMTGEVLFSILKTRAPALKMVIMSGYPLGEKGAELLEQGLIDWFQKPASFKQLSQIMGQALGESPGQGRQ